MEDLIRLYAKAIDSGIKQYIEEYNTLLVKTLKECLKTGDDSIFRDVAIATEYETQFDSMLQIRKEFFNYEEHQKELIAMVLN